MKYTDEQILEGIERTRNHPALLGGKIEDVIRLLDNNAIEAEQAARVIAKSYNVTIEHALSIFTTRTIQRQAIVVTGDKHKGGSFVHYVNGTDRAKKDAAWYRSRGYTVKTMTGDEYVTSLNA